MTQQEVIARLQRILQQPAMAFLYPEDREAIKEAIAILRLWENPRSVETASKEKAP